MEKELFLEPSKELDARFSALQEEYEEVGQEEVISKAVEKAFQK